MRGWSVVTTAILASLVSATPARAAVVINELLADNESVIESSNGFSDYVELHNTADQPVSLAGMSLTDDPLLPRKFVFERDVSIPARGYLLVWCDDDLGGQGIYTGFGLGVGGEVIRLYAPDGATLVDQVRFGLQVADLSIGRIPDGSGVWKLTHPTPLELNREHGLGGSDGLRVNEWMARPEAGDDWLEIYNGAALPVNVSGFTITDDVAPAPGNRPIPALSFIGSHGFQQFFASDLEEPDADHLDFRLGGSGEGGSSIVSFQAGTSTPGESNFAELTEVVISEILSHTDPPFEDAIELQNISSAPIDIGNWWLSDSGASPEKYRIPAGTILPAGQS